MAFQINKSVVKTIPQDFEDLLKPEYKGQVALAGDPRGSGQAISAVTAASIAYGGTNGDGMPGLDFFKKLNEAGNFLPVIGKQGTFAKGETPIVLRWDYLALGDRDALAGNPEVEIVIPKSVAYAGVYVQGISAFSPRPNAAKLWQEFLFSDEGQLLWLKGYATPARFEDLKQKNAVPADLLAKLPKTDAKTVFPTAAELEGFKKSITENWDKVVAADVK
jgi:putative spermidine/putrescine transport system substrate-binding protein